jgi:hypothetical protein
VHHPIWKTLEETSRINLELMQFKEPAAE